MLNRAFFTILTLLVCGTIAAQPEDQDLIMETTNQPMPKSCALCDSQSGKWHAVENGDVLDISFAMELGFHIWKRDGLACLIFINDGKAYQVSDFYHFLEWTGNPPEKMLLGYKPDGTIEEVVNRRDKVRSREAPPKNVEMVNALARADFLGFFSFARNLDMLQATLYACNRGVKARIVGMGYERNESRAWGFYFEVRPKGSDEECWHTPAYSEFSFDRSLKNEQMSGRLAAYPSRMDFVPVLEETEKLDNKGGNIYYLYDSDNSESP